ncbi:HAD family phosphatase [bacterium]|nr:HAD family phosphatase [bacterium]
MLDNIKAVIFDLDGTLIDSMHVWDKVDIDFLQKRGKEVPEDLFSDLPSGDGLLPMAIYFKKKFDLPENTQTIIAEWNSMALDFYSSLDLIKGAENLLNKLLNKNIKLGIGTSNSEVLTEAVLKYNQIRDIFQSVVTGCSISRGKPFPDIYLTVASELDIPPENCLVVEDTVHGVEAAKNAGMKVIAIYNDYSKKDEEILKEKADAFIYNYSELDSLLF